MFNLSFLRYGRHGYKENTIWTECGTDLPKSKGLFCSKFYELTGNKWELRDIFISCGKYDVKPASTIPESVEELLGLVYNTQMMKQTVMEMGFDVIKIPLDNLSVEQITAGNLALGSISEQVIDGVINGVKLTEYCNDFYKWIPQDIGFSKPPLITTQSEVKQKFLLLEVLNFIRQAISMLTFADGNLNSKYRMLGVELRSLDEGVERQIVEKSILSTHVRTLNLQTIEILDIFSVIKDEDRQQFR